MAKTPMPKEFLALHYRYGAAIFELPPSPMTTSIQRKFESITETLSSGGKSGDDGPGPSLEKSIPGKRRRGRRPGSATASVGLAAAPAMIPAAPTVKEIRVRKPRTAEAGGPKIGDRIVEYARDNSPFTLQQVTQALKDVRGNHVKIAINRLWRAGTLFSGGGPYVKGGALKSAEGPYGLIAEQRQQKAA